MPCWAIRSSRLRVTELARALKQPGIKLGVRRAYGNTFDQLRADVLRADQLANEIQSMLEGSFKGLNAEYGFSLQPPTPPQLQQFLKDLELIEKKPSAVPQSGQRAAAGTAGVR